MPTLTENLRAPAEVTRTGYVSALNRVLTRLADFAFPCRHKHLSLPFNDRQTCLDCGATRLYLFDTDYAHANAGIFMGPWRKGYVAPQSAHTVIAKTLIANALAPVKPVSTKVRQRYPDHLGGYFEIEFDNATALHKWEAESRAEHFESAPAEFPAQLARCLDCGKELDAFGICPQAVLSDTTRTHSPVHCGKAARA